MYARINAEREALERVLRASGSRTLWVTISIMGVLLFSWVFYVNPGWLLLISGSFLLVLLVPSSLRLILTSIVAFKLYLAIAASLLATYLFSDSIIPGQPDQYQYIRTAVIIANSIGQVGLETDYLAIVGLHNRLYNVVLGWITYLNGYASISLYRLVNTFAGLLLVVYGVKVAMLLYKERWEYWKYTAIGLALLPFTTLYTMIITRDVLISAFVIMFLYGMLKGSFWFQTVMILLTFYLRLQLAVMLVVMGLGWLVMNNERLSSNTGPRKLLITLSLLAVAAGSYAATIVVPQVAHISTFISSEFLLQFAAAFPLSFFGLDFLFADAAQMNLSRSQLLAGRLIAPETIVLPLMMLLLALGGKRWDLSSLHRRFQIFIWLSITIYSFGYFVEYRLLFVRLLLPFYPVMYLLTVPLFASALKNIRIQRSLRLSSATA